MRILIVLLSSIFTLDVVAQTEHKYEGGIIIHYVDSTSYKIDSTFNSCGKFVENLSIVHYIEGKPSVTYYIVDKKFDEKDLFWYYEVFDIKIPNDKAIIHVDTQNKFINVGKFINEEFYIYIYFLKLE